MSIDALIPSSGAPPGRDSPAWNGTILESASSPADRVRVAIFGADNARHEHGPCPFMPRGLGLPQAGDACLVVFDDDGNPWVAAYEGATGPAGLAPGQGTVWDGMKWVAAVTHELLDVQQDFGSENAYRTGVSATPGFVNMTKNAAATQPLQLTYTPPVDAWWEINLLNAIIKADSAVYGWIYASTLLTPSPVIGPARRRHLVAARSDVNTFQAASMTAMYALAAETPYTVNAQLGDTGAGTSWSHYCGAEFVELSGKAWRR